jgi:hypothetical protein
VRAQHVEELDPVANRYIMRRGSMANLAEAMGQYVARFRPEDLGQLLALMVGAERLTDLRRQHHRVRPHHDDLSTLEEVAEYSHTHPTYGFNRQFIRAYILQRLYQYLKCTSFVETGTYHGSTAGFVRRVFGARVFSSEINIWRFWISRLAVRGTDGVSIRWSSSPEFLRSVCRESVLGGRPMFYLDAHWYRYFPLPEELSVVLGSGLGGAVVIDDFYVPLNPQFGCDEYKGATISLDSIGRFIKPYLRDMQVYFPVYDPTWEPIPRGMAILILGQEHALPKECFPYNFLRRWDLTN